MFLVAVVLDVVYQLIVLRWVYPLETLIVATVLALVPCMVVRGIGNRIVTLLRLNSFATKNVCHWRTRQARVVTSRRLTHRDQPLDKADLLMKPDQGWTKTTKGRMT